jgi:prepilin-type processing-associated H-X9-DG protein
MNRTRCAILLISAIAVLSQSLTAREMTYELVFGWAGYLARVIPNAIVRWDGVVLFIVGTLVFTVLVHWIARWLRREMSDTDAVWRWRSTIAVVGGVMMMFVAGIAMVGITHQTTWLAKEDQALLSPVLVNFDSKSNLRQQGFGVHTYHEIAERLPKPLSLSGIEQSWLTRILPYTIYRSGVDDLKPWDHEQNQAAIRRLVPILLNPALRPVVVRDDNGYGVSHYAGNVHLFESSDADGLSVTDMSDGAANTLMIGEVNANFQPWAKPRTNRDPALGVNRSPNGFGGAPSSGGAHFLMADGRVRFVSSQIDPAIAKALGTPNGGEKIPNNATSRAK